MSGPLKKEHTKKGLLPQNMFGPILRPNGSRKAEEKLDVVRHGFVA